MEYVVALAHYGSHGCPGILVVNEAGEVVRRENTCYLCGVGTGLIEEPSVYFMWEPPREHIARLIADGYAQPIARGE